MKVKRLPALAQVMLVFERLNQLRWEWIFNVAGGNRGNYQHREA